MSKKFLTALLLVCVSILFCSCKPVLNNRETKYESSDVATLTIFSYDGKGESKYGISNLGHSFLSITNNSQKPLELAGKKIEVDEELFFGAWSLNIHFGIWYNIENNYIDLYNKYNNRVSIEMGISNADLDILSDFILKNDTWTVFKNCSYFAINAWNSVALETEKLRTSFIVSTPTFLKNQIMEFKGYSINKPMSFYSGCGYFADLTRTTFKFEGGEAYV